jgi:hypothetical protein
MDKKPAELNFNRLFIYIYVATLILLTVLAVTAIVLRPVVAI